jgi:hypothetical protein
MAVLTDTTTTRALRSWPEMNIAADATRIPTTSTSTDEKAMTRACTFVERPRKRRSTTAPQTDATSALPPARPRVMIVSLAAQPDDAA